MNASLNLMKAMMAMPPLWRAWLVMLVMANMVIPLFYLHTLEGKVVLVGGIVGMVIMSAIFSKKGFVRLLGIGHIGWIPLVLWLSTRLDHAPPDSLFGYWLLSVIILDSLSLIIDATDVARYIRGDRMPYVTITT